jgi:hypothetical protein
MGMQTPRQDPVQPLTQSAKGKIAKQGYVSTGPDHAPQGRLPHIAAFFRAVHPDPNHCEDCRNRNELANMLDNPGSEY